MCTWGVMMLGAALTAACDEAPRSALNGGSNPGSNMAADTGTTDPDATTTASMDGGVSTNPDGMTTIPVDAGMMAPFDSGIPNMMGDCPEAAHFIDVTQYPGAGSAYPAPMLGVTCTNDTFTVASNGIPHYAFQSITPNALAAQNYNWQIPRNPSPAATTSDIPLLGEVGIASNGLPFYGPNEGPMPDPYGDPVFNSIMDDNMGHTAMRGDYHYHTLLVETFWPNTDMAGPSPVVGYALDGFPIYGPRGCLDTACTQVLEFESGWDALATRWEKDNCSTSADCSAGYVCNFAMVDGVRQKICGNRDGAWDNSQYQANFASGMPKGDQYLDQCNGRVGPDGSYRYHVTATFPYIIACYRGTATTGGGGMMMGGTPPHEAACTGLSQGDMCSFTGRGGMTITGTCQPGMAGALVCRP
jgi:hypothetical protein